MLHLFISFSDSILWGTSAVRQIKTRNTGTNIPRYQMRAIQNISEEQLIRLNKGPIQNRLSKASNIVHILSAGMHARPSSGVVEESIGYG